MQTQLFKKNHIKVLSATLIGGTIEWYELYLFIHWHHLFSTFFIDSVALLGKYDILFIFFIGVLGRPVGALLFGDIGDRLGRQLAFTLSIALMIIPSFLIATMGWILPAVGIAAYITLCLLRFIQGMAVGAELPGAMCYLAEIATKKTRIFISSFAFVGPHIGILLSQLESYLFDKYFSVHFIETYGWRLSFAFGGFLALLGVIFRNRLDESPEFIKIRNKHLLSHKPILDSFANHWRTMTHSFLTFLVSVVVFFMYTIFLEVYLHQLFSTDKMTTFVTGIIITITEIIFLPFWGFLGTKYSAKKFLIGSTLLILISTLCIYFFQSIAMTIFFSACILIGLNVQSGLMPGYTAQLFPTAVRYTGIAIAFSICDSLIGGAVPWLGGLLSKQIGLKEAFVLLAFLSACISMIAFLTRKEKAHNSRTLS